MRARILYVLLFAGLLNTDMSAQVEWLVEGTWTSTAGNLSIPQSRHCATLLNDGRVLILGDIADRTAFYDPEAETFSEGPNMALPHGQGVRSLLLSDGTVLITGGDVSPEGAELYDPVSGTFTQTGNLTVGRSNHSMTELDDGRVVLAGGQTPDNQSITSIEIFDPATGTSAMSTDLSESRSGHSATLAYTGQIVMIGGTHTTGPGIGVTSRLIEIFDPETETVRQSIQMPEGRTAHRSTLLNDGRILVTGGNRIAAAGIFTPDDESWTEVPQQYVRSAHQATMLETGHVLLSGGSYAVGPIVSRSTEVFYPGPDVFLLADSLTTPRQSHTASLLSDGKLLVTGGYDGDQELASAETYSYALVLDNEPGIPDQADVSLTAYPNPTRDRVHFRVQTAVFTRVSLEVLDIQGRVVSQVLSREIGPGTHVFSWDTGESDGSRMAGGVYFCRLDTGYEILTRTVMVLR